MKSEISNATIHSKMIQLDQLIKWLGLSDTGGQARILIDNGRVMVNGKIVLERRKKIVPGDVLTIDRNEYLIIAEDE